jgi:hypothetical protein
VGIFLSLQPRIPAHSSFLYLSLSGKVVVLWFFSKEMQSLWSGYFYYIPMLAFFAYNGINAVVFVFYRFSLLLTVMVMNIDLSRYQLATLSLLIESV